MKIRHGLQKKISFIFDNGQTAQVPQNTAGLPAEPSSNVLAASAAKQKGESLPLMQQDSESLTQTEGTVWDSLNEGGSDSHSQAEGKISCRPIPVPKQSSAAMADKKTAMDVFNTAKGVLFGGKTSRLDKRQKKMTIMVALLAVVLVVVLIIALNPGASKVNAAVGKGLQDEAAVIKKDLVYQWKQPQVYPASLRDPMRHASQARANTGETQSDLIIRGIVYSDTNPTAIIAGQIVKQGETVAGSKIVKINRDSVEFEKDGKHWIQQVEQ